MSHTRGHRRVRAEELPTADIEDSEPTTGLTTGDLTNSPSHSVDPQQSLKVEIFRQEYSEFITLKDNAEVVLAEAMEAIERLNTVFSRVRASMNRMPPRMKELLIVPADQASGKTLEPNQTSMIGPAPESGAEERTRTTRSRVPGDRYSRAPLSRNIPENIPHSARGEQSDNSQLRHGCEVHTVYAWDTPEARVSDPSRVRFPRDIRVTERTHVSPTESMRLRCDTSPINTRREPVSVNMRDRPSLSANQVIQGIPDSIEHSWRSIIEPQSIDMNALREEIKSMISATIKEKLCQGTPLYFRPEPFCSELPLVSTTLRDRFRVGSTLSTFVDFCGWRVGGLVGDSGHLVEGICAYSHSA
ncbi:hypothetical protein M422DRAFT_273597 [Sphaerobolus stellatus SS14]|uniref:Uncharacterized protein n=1 Tax=Sphaerobolus stellatus (strain SS14) TaxID=990650 RepID=A0A0C9T8V1_SPHS4|nr:hypothetical protein M422DRAFT_273597 [Sphaerobolus stellatus SS14]